MSDEDKNMVDVSVSNLFTEMQYGNGRLTSFDVLNPSDMKGKSQQLSAGPRFTKKARIFLIKNFDVDPAGFSGNTACCRIQRGRLTDFNAWVMSEYLKPESAVIDLNHSSALEERLTRPYWKNIPPPLSEFEFVLITLDFQDFLQHPVFALEAGEKQLKKLDLFVKWSLWTCEQSIFRKLKECPAISLRGIKGHQLRLSK